MENLFQHIAALSFPVKLIYSILGVALIRGAFRLLERTLPVHFETGDHRYLVRKGVAASGYIVILVFITILFEDPLKRAALTLGLFGAGIIVALQDVIASFGGFVMIHFSDLYRVGDRIQVNETKGDVIDITLMRTKVMETGNWVSGDLYNGRIVRIPNSVVLKGVVFNYSQGFRFVWDEIKIRLNHGSDHRLAREMLVRVAKATVSAYLVKAQRSWKRITENYRIENPLLEPTVTLQADGGALEFSISYIVDYTKRTIVKDQLFTEIVDEIANSNRELQWSSSLSPVTPRRATTDFPQPPQSRPFGHDGIF